jgi:TolB protein
MRMRIGFAVGVFTCFLLGSVGFDSVGRAVASEANNALSQYQIGYSEYRTNLPGGRRANEATTRAYVINADGSGRRELVPELIRNAYTGNQFVGWSPDGRTAILCNGYESPENAAWEEAHKQFRQTEGYLVDCYLLDMATGKATNVSAPERASNLNPGVSYWPGNPNKLQGDALIGGVNHPLSMNVDGTNKVDLIGKSTSYTYGTQVSLDGKRIAYHADYQVYIAKADGSNPRHIKTGNGFNFMPKWLPDGKWLAFLSGPSNTNSNPYLVAADGTGLRKLADRNGYGGAVPLFDVYDFHGGASDLPAWAPDGSCLYYTAKVRESVELMRVTLDGTVTQLTQSTNPGTLNYWPTPSPDGQWIMFGSNSSGTRQLYVMPAEGGPAHAITNVPPGYGAKYGRWNPVITPEPSSCALMTTGGLVGGFLWRHRFCQAWQNRRHSP